MKTSASKSGGANASAPVTTPSPSAASNALTATATPAGENTSSTPISDDPNEASSSLVYEPPRRKILCNPSAGDVHRRESGAPWRVEADEKIRAANAKAKDEQLEKRRWGLAKQLQDGLMHTYGMNYGVAELSTLLRTGVALKAQQQQQQQVELASHEVAFVQLLAAAEKYDLKQVVMLLDKFPKGRTTGSTKRK